MEDEEGGSRVESGVTKRVPRWVTPFLRSLERTGEVRAAAEDAGIDYTTAYGRRRAHGEFALAWDEALRVHGEKRRLDEAVAVDALTRDLSTSASSGNGPPRRSAEELIGAGAQLKRVGHGRWSLAKERLFF